MEVSRPNRLRRLACATLLAGGLASLSGAAHAQAEDAVSACLAQHTEGQKLRQQQRLIESREAFRQCSASQCPSQLIRDCLEWSEQYDRQIPSLSVRVLSNGEIRTDARIFIDGEPVLDPLSGKATEVNPGAHRVRVEVPSLSPTEKEIIVSEGEQFRIVNIELQLPLPAPGASDKPPITPSPAAVEPARHRPVPVASYVFAGLSVAAAASGTAWGLSMRSLQGDLEDECAPSCGDDSVDVLKQRALLADISFGVSAASLVTAVVFYALRPEEPLEEDPVSVGVNWLPSGGAVGTLSVTAF